MQKTKIDWPGLSYSWSPIVGCSFGCKYCYARKLNDRFRFIPDFSKPTFFPERLNEPLKVKKPSTIFVCSMGEIMDGMVQVNWTNQIVEVMKNTPQHTYMLLSKQPFRYKRWDFPDNVWLGATMESGKAYGRLADLKDNMRNKLFISAEPILGTFKDIDFLHIDLVIVGANSSAGAKIPPIKWVKSIDHFNIWYKRNIREYYPELINSPQTTSVT